ncbi:MAG TPA: MotA/TolQ/ExbB proton channel family protein [Oligoflexia bacterium]|nr:MotA/TolQ/ExbB proton channel family protein [Oligoflexia bacterium]HMR25184.1 MotA/TolQ/ExbB proton channel family protein [Oligoflexia bacterium]
MSSFFDVYWHSRFMQLNTIVSIIALGVILERVYMLWAKYSVNGVSFMQTIERHILANDLNSARNFANTSKSPLATVVKSGLAKAPLGGMAVSMGIDEALLQVTPRIEKRIGSLWAIANIATLVGLIGTIWGLSISFGALGGLSAEARAEAMGVGIAEALYNTMLGLSIAVICIIAHLILSGWAKKIIGDLDYYTSRLENLLTIRHESEAA